PTSLNPRCLSDYNSRSPVPFPPMHGDHPRALVEVEHIPIRWGDMDAMGHVNNTVYFRYMEQVRVRWYERMFGALSGAQEFGMVIVNASCNFRRALTYPGTAEVRMFVANAGRSSIGSLYEIAMDGTLYADGAAKIVFIDVKRNKALPLPARVGALV